MLRLQAPHRHLCAGRRGPGPVPNAINSPESGLIFIPGGQTESTEDTTLKNGLAASPMYANIRIRECPEKSSRPRANSCVEEDTLHARAKTSARKPETRIPCDRFKSQGDLTEEDAGVAVLDGDAERSVRGAHKELDGLGWHGARHAVLPARDERRRVIA